MVRDVEEPSPEEAALMAQGGETLDVEFILGTTDDESADAAVRALGSFPAIRGWWNHRRHVPPELASLRTADGYWNVLDGLIRLPEGSLAGVSMGLFRWPPGDVLSIWMREQRLREFYPPREPLREGAAADPGFQQFIREIAEHVYEACRYRYAGFGWEWPVSEDQVEYESPPPEHYGWLLWPADGGLVLHPPASSRTAQS